MRTTTTVGTTPPTHPRSIFNERPLCRLQTHIKSEATVQSVVRQVPTNSDYLVRQPRQHCKLTDGHVVVDHAETAMQGHLNRHRGFRDSVHRGRHQRGLHTEDTRHEKKTQGNGEKPERGKKTRKKKQNKKHICYYPETRRHCRRVKQNKTFGITLSQAGESHNPSCGAAAWGWQRLR